MGKTNHFRAIAAVVAVALSAGVLVSTGPAEAAFPGKNGKIVFVSDRVIPDNPTGDLEIFTMNPDGAALKQLTFNTADELDPTYSPDGKRIAYTGFDGDHEIFTIPASGGAPTNVTNNATEDLDPSYSPDGSAIAYEDFDGADDEIVKIPASGGTPANVTSNVTADRDPVFSPNGERIAYTGFDSDAEVFTIPASGGAPTNVTENTTDDFGPAYSPGGKRISYWTEDFGGADDEIFTIPVTGGTPTNVTDNTTDDRAPAYSPDGKRIVYGSRVGPDWFDIFTIPAAGGTTANLTNLTKEDSSPDWQTNSASKITSVRPLGKTRDRTPLIRATVRDRQTDLAKSGIRLFVDGKARPFTYDTAVDRLLHGSKKLSFGKHAVRVVARDEVGLKTTRRWSFKVVR
ncbi:MAG: TolB family protein [Rubrobacteraceae bacterium]